MLKCVFKIMIVNSQLAGRRDWATICIYIVGGAEILAFVRWLQDLEGAHQRVVDGHHRARVVEFAAVVGRAKQGHQLAA